MGGYEQPAEYFLTPEMVGGGTNKLIEGVIVVLLATEFEPRDQKDNIWVGFDGV